MSREHANKSNSNLKTRRKDTNILFLLLEERKSCMCQLQEYLGQLRASVLTPPEPGRVLVVDGELLFFV
jgi:hypothetical protein